MVEQSVLEFAGLLRQLRSEAKLTQEELADAAGVSARSVSDLERGINRTHPVPVRQGPTSTTSSAAGSQPPTHARDTYSATRPPPATDDRHRSALQGA